MKSSTSPRDPRLVVRAASAAERPQLVRFLRELQEVERGLHPNRAPGRDIADEHLAYLEGRARNDSGAIFVVDDSEGLAGFLVCFVEENDHGNLHVIDSERRYGFVSDVYVAERARRRGAGRVLLDAAEDHLRGVGVKTVRLSFLAGNSAARSAYENAGYAPYELVYEKAL